MKTIAPTPRSNVPMAGPSEQRLDWLARRHSVLGNPIRLRILALLIGGAASTGADLTRKIPGITQPTISNHVRSLIDVGFIFKREDHSLVVCPDAFLALFDGTNTTLGLS